MAIWMKIKNYDYFISDNGEIVNFKGKKIKTPINNAGYKKVSLYKDGKYKHTFVHRLVAETFIPNKENKPAVDHINTIRDDNRIENLRWVTYKENSNNDITREHLRQVNMGENNPAYNTKHTDEWKEKMKKRMSGKGNPMYNVPCPNAKTFICKETGEINTSKFFESKYNLSRGYVSHYAKNKYSYSKTGYSFALYE